MLLIIVFSELVELEVFSTIELLVTLVELREMTSLPEESWMALESLPLDGSV